MENWITMKKETGLLSNDLRNALQTEDIWENKGHENCHRIIETKATYAVNVRPSKDIKTKTINSENDWKSSKPTITVQIRYSRNENNRIISAVFVPSMSKTKL